MLTLTHTLMKRSLLARATMMVMSVSAFVIAPHAHAGIVFSINIAPPLLPVYEQSVIPAAGYLWAPGYWAYEDEDGDYFWVPGTWVRAPYIGALWTPGYWDWDEGEYEYVFHDGYWGYHVGYYGNIDYGFGYTGEGYEGGYWYNGGFYYNTAVNRIRNIHITTVYNKTVINNTTINNYNYSFNGPGGANGVPTPMEIALANERHVPPTPAQVRQISLAAQNKTLYVAENHGVPPIAATTRPGAFRGAGVVRAKFEQPLAPRANAVPRQGVVTGQKQWGPVSDRVRIQPPAYGRPRANTAMDSNRSVPPQRLDVYPNLSATPEHRDMYPMDNGRPSSPPPEIQPIRPPHRPAIVPYAQRPMPPQHAQWSRPSAPPPRAEHQPPKDKPLRQLRPDPNDKKNQQNNGR